MKQLFTLFLTFARIGLFTFGGGYAMLPMLTRVVAGEKKWVTEDELIDFYAISQCTPGIIAVNTATFIGVKLKGIAGAVFATLGLIFPSVVIITLIAAFLRDFGSNEDVQNALAGARVAACALMTVAVIRLGRKAIRSIISAVIAAGAFVLAAFFGASPVWIALGAVVLGTLYAVVITRRRTDK